MEYLFGKVVRMAESFLIHIPHSSTYIPLIEKEKFMLTEEELQQELLVMTDWYIDELFNIPEHEKQINKISRLVMDPERFRDDNDEEMSGCGMGAIYTNTSDGRQLRKILSDERERLLIQYYDPYHQQFTEKVEKILDSHGRCLIIDAHSFPSTPLPYEKSNNAIRPAICIGYNDFNNIPGLPRISYEIFFWDYAMDVRFNEPFSGSIVPSKYYKVDKRVASIMIEINRSLYMDEKTGAKLPNFGEIKDMLKKYFEYIPQFI